MTALRSRAGCRRADGGVGGVLERHASPPRPGRRGRFRQWASASVVSASRGRLHAARAPGVRAVLGHELTHARPDQWFGLNRPKLARSKQELSTGWDALTEGAAERTRKAYEATLSAADKKAADREEGGDSAAPKGVP